jgi:hypothetical protein
VLLLLKGAPPANAQVTFATNLGVTFVNAGTSVTFATTMGFGPFDSVELQVSATLGLTTGFSATGFLSLGPGVTFATNLGLAAQGGFANQVTFANQLNSGWTVGSTLQGSVAFGTLTALSGDLRVVPGVSFGTLLGFSPGQPVVSGGTLTPGVSFGLQMGLVAAPYLVDSARFTLISDFTATLQPAPIPAFATQMRLSFSADTIRTFFRKG